MSNFRKPPVVASVLTILGLGVLCTLGTWQLQRLEWKEDLLAKIESGTAETYDVLTLDHLKPENEFLKGRLIGRFDFGKEIAIKPRTYDGKPGIHIITPFILESGQTILINRGWAPDDYNLGAGPDGENDAVDIMLRVPVKPNMFVPQNRPEQNEWYALNIEQISKAMNLSTVLPVAGYELNMKDRESEHPFAHALKIKLNNNHMQYAMFWYAMAVIMLGVFYLRFVSPKKT